MTENLKIIIYSDGAASGNPGPGGYGAILMSGRHKKEISRAFRMTTNNRMELLAVIDALSLIKKVGADVTIFTDSRYVVDSIEKKWLNSWVATGFRKKKNADLWQQYLDVAARHNIVLHWVKGHAGNELNNRCDELAVNAYRSGVFEIDEVYEQQRNEI